MENHSSKLKSIVINLENFYAMAIVVPLILWIAIYIVVGSADSEYTKKVLKAIWFLGVMIHLINWIVAGFIKITLDFKGVRTFEEANGTRRLFSSITLLNIAHNKSLIVQFMIYYLIQFNYTSLIGFGSTFLGGLFVYILVNRI